MARGARYRDPRTIAKRANSAARHVASILALHSLAVPALLAAACSSTPSADDRAAADDRIAADARAVTNGRAVADDPAAADDRTAAVRLPDGEGRDVLEQACTGCHDLDGLSAYRGYYDESRWRTMISTMVSYGAELDEAEIATAAEYLAEHFGPGGR